MSRGLSLPNAGSLVGKRGGWDTLFTVFGYPNAVLLEVLAQVESVFL